MLAFLLSVILVCVVVGVALWAANKFLAKYMQAEVLRLMNIAVVAVLAICLLLWILGAFGLVPTWGPPLPRWGAR